MSTTCSSCGRQIVFAITENGAKTPLDYPPEKRSVIVHGQELVKKTEPLILGGAFEAMVRSVVADTYVPHFATCPSAARHRKAHP